ncbi:unnamed protein product, partial [Discosporangium mesarthrocarpum]
RLSKKNGNYLGTVRCNLNRNEAIMYTNDQEKEELGAVLFDKPGLVDHLKAGSLPRKFRALLPPLEADGTPTPFKVNPFNPEGSMIALLKAKKSGNFFPLDTKEPRYENGNYRLNFRGRVTIPSVKNFQLTSPDDSDYIVCQFGKVGEDEFNLDYRAPVNAFQAFSIALAQFNF